MPACFQLLSRINGEPSVFAHIDDALCKHLNVEAHPVHYYQSWYDIIGMSIACGKDFAWCRSEFPSLIPVIDYLDANYTTTAWYEVKA